MVNLVESHSHIIWPLRLHSHFASWLRGCRIVAAVRLPGISWNGTTAASLSSLAGPGNVCSWQADHYLLEAKVTDYDLLGSFFLVPAKRRKLFPSHFRSFLRAVLLSCGGKSCISVGLLRDH